MKVKLLLLSGLTLLAVALAAGISFSWLVSNNDSGTVQAKTAKINTKLDFELNTSYGIPGETIVIAGTGIDVDIDDGKSRNKITNEGTEDYIFRISYTVSYSDSELIQPYITDLMLAGADELGLILAGGGYDRDSQTLVYYGRHNKGNEVLDLGELHATFEILKRIDMGQPFAIEAEIEACQATEAAVSDILGIDASIGAGKYAALFAAS